MFYNVAVADAETIVEFLTGGRASPSAVPWRHLRREDLQVIRQWAGTTRPERQRDILREMRLLVRSSLTAAAEDEFEDLPERAVPYVRPMRIAAARLSQREAKLLLDVMADASGLAGVRDAAVIGLMLLAGPRRQEIAALEIGDFESEEACLWVKDKRGPARLVTLRGRCLDLLERWLEARGGGAGPLFPAIDMRGEVLLDRLSVGAVYRIVRRRAGEAGQRLSPRDLRAYFLRRLQMQARNATDGVPLVCRYLQREDGQPAWSLPSLAGA
jgi:integrase